MNLTAVVMGAAGVVLMYAAVKGKDPRDIVRNALGKKDTHQGFIGPLASEITPSATHNDGTQIVTV
jgi:hypothetical protein